MAHLQVLLPPVSYPVTLGAGVALSPIVLARGTARTAPLHARGREAREQWYVELKSAMLPLQSAVPTLQGAVHILAQLCLAFALLKPHPVVLAG